MKENEASLQAKKIYYSKIIIAKVRKLLEAINLTFIGTGFHLQFQLWLLLSQCHLIMAIIVETNNKAMPKADIIKLPNNQFIRITVLLT